MDKRERPEHLRGLNNAQYSAVVHNPKVPLQILAGPGSGKTRTLTYRIAHLIKEHNVEPSKIVAVTFTNKAANELRVRLHALIGEKAASALVLGTFHSICGRLLRQHGHAINIQNNFSICDADESKKIINGILKDMVAASGAHATGAQRLDIKDIVAVELISKAKAKCITPEEMESTARRDLQRTTTLSKGETSPHIMLQLSPVYKEYVEECQKHNALDFDDLLMLAVKLLKKKPDCIDIEHVFVDEFQDTNTTQFELMVLFAAKHGNVSVVGDPDQSIYAWRSAEVENLARMILRFPNTQQIYLEDNYRSTGAILAASVAIISEDTNRPPKTLRTSHAFGATPTLGSCADEHEEAACIADEIKRLKLISGGLLKWSDFAILLRFNALSRNIETALQREGIPNRVLSGHKFFERIEIKDLLAYLQIIDNFDFDPAALRIINVPKRNIGNKSVEELRKKARKMKKPVMHVVEKIVDGRIPDINPPVLNKAKELVRTMQRLRKLSQEGMSVVDLIQELLTAINYVEYLKTTQQDWEARWENIRELITFATETVPTAGMETTITVPTSPTSTEPIPLSAVGDDESESSSFATPFIGKDTPEEDWGSQSKPILIFEDDQEEEEAPSLLPEKMTPLRAFLQATSLSTDTLVNEDDTQEKVIISTCHAAKGLEWPVVFVPSVEQGTFPFYRSDDTEEERRLLYVACTRAQVLLYLTHAGRRKIGGESKANDLSEFVKAVIDKDTAKTIFTHNKPILHAKEFGVLGKILERKAPDPKECDAGVSTYLKSKPAPIAFQGVKGNPEPQRPNNAETRLISERTALSATFQTARSVIQSASQTKSPPLETVRKPSAHALTSYQRPVSSYFSQGQPAPSSNGSAVLQNAHKTVESRSKGLLFRPQASPVSSSIPRPLGMPEENKGEKTHPSLDLVEDALSAEAVKPPPIAPKLAGTKRRLGMTPVTKMPRLK